jgi:hypothetical protein
MPMYIASLFTIAKICTSRGAHEWMTGEKWDIYPINLLFRGEVVWKSIICSKIHESVRCYVKLNKPDTERQVLHILSHMQKLKKCNFKVEQWLVWIENCVHGFENGQREVGFGRWPLYICVEILYWIPLICTITAYY